MVRVIKKEQVAEREAQITEALQIFNRLSGKDFKVENPEYRMMIKLRLDEGHTIDDVKAVIIYKCREWKDVVKMYPYLSPNTLFKADNFSRYVDQVMNLPIKIDVEAELQPKFLATDMYNRCRMITQAQFDKAEEGYFQKDIIYNDDPNEPKFKVKIDFGSGMIREVTQTQFYRAEEGYFVRVIGERNDLIEEPKFRVCDIYGSRFEVTQTQFDKAEEGYLTRI
jgi:uncharacterized phage protein (TIGR02220 family)